HAPRLRLQRQRARGRRRRHAPGAHLPGVVDAPRAGRRHRGLLVRDVGRGRRRQRVPHPPELPLPPGAGITYQVPLGDADQFAQFSLEYYGTTSDVSGQVFGTRDPTSVTPLAHTLDPSTGRYVASFITDQQTPPGSYRIVMKGQDKFGNEVVSKSKPFLLRTSSVTVSWDQVLAQGSLQEGKPFTASFVAKYQNGLVMDDTLGKPSVALLVDNKPSRVRPDVSYANGHWVLTWDAPSDLPRGAYIFTVGGTDFSGNQILTSQEN